MPEKPLLTFALASYNQENFIREAVEAAFAQTYSPLEIILSDDCSEDRTYEILTEMARSYRGPHRVVLNRNPTRRSIGGHLNRILELAHGELVLAAAADDISLPQRAQVTWEAWEASERKATSVHSRIIQINSSGRVIDEVFRSGASAPGHRFVPQSTDPKSYVRTLEPLILGCAHAFSRKLFNVFGPLPEEALHEDNALGFRGVLGGGLMFIDEPLVKYRVHESNVFIHGRQRAPDIEALRRREDWVRRRLAARVTMYHGFSLDLQAALRLGFLTEGVAAETAAEIARRKSRTEAKLKFLESGFLRKCLILSRLASDEFTRDEFNLLARRLLPQPLFLRLSLARGLVSSAFVRGDSTP